MKLWRLVDTIRFVMCVSPTYCFFFDKKRVKQLLSLYSFSLVTEYVLKESSSTVITIDCTPILEPEHIITELKRVSLRYKMSVL